mmetsp:Transcript_37995/g.72849  ORF Transcript_37995/g.72849 Transcript_37995/m.72849 type:complete len:401 (-) Transcript_37995:433-1635(-)
MASILVRPSSRAISDTGCSWARLAAHDRLDVFVFLALLRSLFFHLLTTLFKRFVGSSCRRWNGWFNVKHRLQHSGVQVIRCHVISRLRQARAAEVKHLSCSLEVVRLLPPALEPHLARLLTSRRLRRRLPGVSLHCPEETDAPAVTVPLSAAVLVPARVASNVEQAARCGSRARLRWETSSEAISLSAAGGRCLGGARATLGGGLRAPAEKLFKALVRRLARHAPCDLVPVVAHGGLGARLGLMQRRHLRRAPRRASLLPSNGTRRTASAPLLHAGLAPGGASLFVVQGYGVGFGRRDGCRRRRGGFPFLALRFPVLATPGVVRVARRWPLAHVCSRHRTPGAEPLPLRSLLQRRRQAVHMVPDFRIVHSVAKQHRFAVRLGLAHLAHHVRELWPRSRGG